MYTLTVTLASGQAHTFTVGHMPRHWKSYVIQHMPYATDYYGARWNWSEAR